MTSVDTAMWANAVCFALNAIAFVFHDSKAGRCALVVAISNASVFVLLETVRR